MIARNTTIGMPTPMTALALVERAPDLGVDVGCNGGEVASGVTSADVIVIVLDRVFEVTLTDVLGLAPDCVLEVALVVGLAWPNQSNTALSVLFHIINTRAAATHIWLDTVTVGATLP